MTEPPRPLHLDVAADAAAVGHVLDGLASWLESVHVRELDHIVVQHAVDELVTNVVEHAYVDAGSTGRLRWTRHCWRLVSWRSTSPTRGHGWRRIRPAVAGMA